MQWTEYMFSMHEDFSSFEMITLRQVVETRLKHFRSVREPYGISALRLLISKTMRLPGIY